MFIFVYVRFIKTTDILIAIILKQEIIFLATTSEKVQKVVVES
jgi:hypothetical protein